MTKQHKRTAIFVLCLVFAILVLSGAMLWGRPVASSAYDSLPSEFGAAVGAQVQDAQGNIYVNYTRGYVKYAPGSDTGDPTAASAHVGGKNVSLSDGQIKEELISAETMTSLKNWDTIVGVDMAGARVAYGPDWGADAAKKVGNAFKEKWEELIQEGYNLGIPCSDVNVYNRAEDGQAIVFGMEFRYGDSVYAPDGGNGGKTNMSYLLYNVLNDEAYLVKDGFAGITGDDMRLLGAPVSEEIGNVTVTGYNGNGNEVNATNATVQVFEKGILIGTNADAGKVTSVAQHIGVVEKVSDTEYKIYPLIRDQDIYAKSGSGLSFIGDVDGTWHALRTARVVSHENGRLTVQFNFRAGCIEAVFADDHSLISRMAYAGQNFAYDEAGNSARVTLPTENFTTDEHLWEGVESGTLAMYQNLSGNAGATENNMKADFRAAYMELLESGIIPGYRCSSIKIWDILCVDYKYSPDSAYGFDGVGSAGRERMYTLVYSGVQKRVYGVGDDFWLAWKEDPVRRALGAPISNAMENMTISGQTFSRIQIFEQGYIYESENGSMLVEYGVTTDNEYKNFIYEPAPSEKPSQYGSEVAKYSATENGRSVVYINYERGAVKATAMYTGTGYLYEYFPGRNFIADNGTYTAQLLSFDVLYDISDFTDPSNSGIFEDHEDDNGNYVAGAKTQMIEKIQSLMAQGFFPGFLERTFQSWNGVYGQQFIYGDSTAQPWGGDSRTEVCALIWNDSLGQVFLLKDAFMELWAGTKSAYMQLGAPASDEFTLNGNPNVIFQYFYGTSLQNNRVFAASVGYNEATYYASSSDSVTPESYLAAFSELSKPLSGVAFVQPENPNVAVGSFTMLEYTVEGAIADADIEITSSDESVATVMADGSVEFLEAGTVTITIRVSNGAQTFTDSVTFTVGGGADNSALVWGCVGGAIGLVVVAACVVAVVLVKKKRKNNKHDEQ